MEIEQYSAFSNSPRYQRPRRHPPLLAARAQVLDLPRVQYSARDVRSGWFCWAFAQRRSAAASSVFAARIQQHLSRCGISLRDLVWQTDNGSKFVGSHDGQGHRTGLSAALGDSQHVRIPPAAHTFQSDVETVHRLVDDEFFDWNRPPVAAPSSPRSLPIGSTSTSFAPTPTDKTSVPGRSSRTSNHAPPLQLCLLPPVFLDY